MLQSELFPASPNMEEPIRTLLVVMEAGGHCCKLPVQTTEADQGEEGVWKQ